MGSGAEFDRENAAAMLPAPVKDRSAPSSDDRPTLQQRAGNQAMQREANSASRTLASAPTAAAKQLPGHPAREPIPLPRVERSFSIQPKLTVGPIDDPLEREADEVVDRVMRMPDPAGTVSSSASPALQRKCACGGTYSQCKQEQSSYEPLWMKSAASAAQAGMPAPSSVDEVLRSPGQPLDAATRAFFEPRFAQDFNHVRVHTGEAAAQSAQDVDARAYTAGNNIVFGEGGFDPAANAGRDLLAHELAHVVQQVGVGNPSPLVVQRTPQPSKADAGPLDAKSAKIRATSLAKRIRNHGKVSKEVRAAIVEDLSHLEGGAKRIYIREIAPALREVQDIEVLDLLGESAVPPHDLSPFALTEQMARDPFYKTDESLGIGLPPSKSQSPLPSQAPRLTPPVVDPRTLNQEGVPPYLKALDERLGRHLARQVEMFAEKTGPLEKLTGEFPGGLPLKEGAVIEIPALDFRQGPAELHTVLDPNAPGGIRVVGPPSGEFQLHSRLPGGYELVEYDPNGRKVLVGYGGVGYVLFDSDFAALFGDEGLVSNFIETTEEAVKFRHEHALGLVLAQVAFEIGMYSLMFLQPELAAAAEVTGPEATVLGTELPGVPEVEDVPGMLPAAGEAEATIPGWQPFNFATDDAWIYDGRAIRVVDTPSGPRAFYQRTGGGGEFFLGAQPGDWVPFEGFQPQPSGAHFVKASFTKPDTPPTLYRWGTEENQAIGAWIRDQPVPAYVDVGEAWGVIQQRLEGLGVPVRYPLHR